MSTSMLHQWMDVSNGNVMRMLTPRMSMLSECQGHKIRKVFIVSMFPFKFLFHKDMTTALIAESKDYTFHRATASQEC